MTPPQSRTQQPSRLPAAPQKGLEAPRAMALQSGYGAMVPTTVHAPDRLPVVQEDAVVQGVISFSSNHNLPIERKKKHTLQSTKKYLAPNSERG